ncbi:MAG: hemolysin family protein [bacterium]
MDSRLLLELLAILLLIIANGFFALSEFSVIASRKSRLRQKVSQGKLGAARAAKLHDQPDKFLATIQVGITLFGTVAGVLGGATIVDRLTPIIERVPLEFMSRVASLLAVALVAVVITIVAVIIGELVPKYLALSNPEKFARLTAVPITVFIRLTSSITWLLSGAARLVLRFFGVARSSAQSLITEEEINLMIDDGRKKGVFDDIEEKLIKSVFDFADSTVRRAMTPRTDIIGIRMDTPPDKIIDIIIEHGHGRYPVYTESIDYVSGVLFTKDLIIHQKLNPQQIILKDILRPAVFVPDSMPLARLLRDFQRKKNQLAIVLDEFGGTEGIVTLEDILEELVGEIQDEDEAGLTPLVKHSETIAFADGTVWPGAVNELMDSQLPENRAETLAGLVIDQLGRLPEKNETVVIADMQIRILERQHHRITRLKLEKITREDHQH